MQSNWEITKMTAKQKFIEEKDDLKNSRMNRILHAAFVLFSENGIDTIAMTDIAKKAEIGVASLYRYYETKDEIAIQTAIWAWQEQKNYLMPELTNNNFDRLEGIAQLKKIFELFISLYEKQGDFLRFIYFFDSYAVRQKIQQTRLTLYQSMIESVEETVEKAITKGISDKSINSKFIGQEKVLYFSLMHALFSTSQKLTLSGNMLKMDSEVFGKKELEVLSDLLINSLK